MKQLPDGYKVIENDDLYTKAIIAMKENIDLLYERIKKLEERAKMEFCEYLLRRMEEKLIELMGEEAYTEFSNRIVREANRFNAGVSDEGGDQQ